MSTVSDTSNVSLGQQMELATASAKNQMKFQERMSNTAHQREVKDLQAAGLNPVLSAGGQGASTPSGAEGDYSGAKTLESELKELLNVSNYTSGKAISAVSNIANTINKIFDKYEVKDENEKVNNILNSLSGNGKDFVMDDGVRNAFNKLGIYITPKGLSLGTRNAKSKYGDKAIGVGDLIATITEGSSAIGKRLAKKGIRTDSADRILGILENAGVDTSKVKKKNSQTVGDYLIKLLKVYNKNVGAMLKGNRESYAYSNSGSKSGTGLTPTAINNLEKALLKSSGPSKHSTSTHSAKMVVSGNGGR